MHPNIYFQNFFNRLLPLFVAGLALLCWSGATQAASGSHKTAAEEFLLLIKMPEQLQTLATQAVTPMRVRLSQMKASQERADIVRKYLDIYEKLVFDSFAWENNKKDYIELYTKTYSEFELKSLISFFKSDAGKKFLSPGVEFQNTIASLNQSRVDAIKPSLDKAQANLQKELQQLRTQTSQQ